MARYPLYGVAAMQVILAAIEKSDGTRKGVTEAVLSGEGITIPADRVGHRQGDQDRPGHGRHHRPRTSPSEIVKGGKETFFKSAALQPSVINPPGPGSSGPGGSLLRSIHISLF